jgi:hypothetical protein
MSTQNLSSVAYNVVGQYNEAGKNLVRAYRAGTDRAVGAVDKTFVTVVTARPLPLVTDTVKTNLIGAEQKITGLVSRGAKLGADRADVALDQIARGVNFGIERLSSASAKVENALVASAVQAVNDLTMPAAQVSLQFANLLAQGSKRVADKVAGEEIVVAVVAKKKAVKKAAAKRATRRA